MNEQITLQKALYTIKKLKHLLNEEKKSFEPIAIIGIGCRFPQVIGKNAYWEMLKNGRNVITNIPEKRWELLNGTDEILLRDEKHPYWGGFLSDISRFDAYYFGISPREAIRIDPQHRLLLEVAHEAVEDAGIPLDSLAGTQTGVFTSLYVSQLAHLQKMDHEMDAIYLPTGNAISIAANRISYLFDLRGPSVVVDSACSSSMTSLHLACLNLQTQTCNLALVCGAKLNLLPYVNFVLTKAKMLSPDGQCKTFDADANGYVQGEGVGVVVLKPLTKALADRDRIYAVITGSALNQDGKTNGLTAPNGLQQENLLTSAYQVAGVNPLDISYIECHGTGTFLGDPIEVEALGGVVGKTRDSNHPCFIGSVKTNIGHLEPAAGIAGLIKVALALKNAEIPPHLNFNTPNPHITFNKYNFVVPKKLQGWPKYNNLRLAGLSGFGFGGSNAHVVMRDLTDNENQSLSSESPPSKQTEVFTLSAKNTEALEQLVIIWCNYLEENSSMNLGKICFNVHVRRMHYPFRLAILATTTAELFDSLCLVRDKKFPLSNVLTSAQKDDSYKLRTVNNLEGLDLEILAKMYVSNARINWKKIEEDRYYQHIEMPLYPWQHKEYWPPLGNKVNQKKIDVHPLQGKKLASPLDKIQFEFLVSNELLPDLKDTYNILHAGYYLEILAFSINELTKQSKFTVLDHQFLAPIIASSHLTTVQLVLEPNSDSSYSFAFYSRAHDQNNWSKNASGNLKLQVDSNVVIDTIHTIKARCNSNESSELLYQRVKAMGMPAGESIRWTQQYWYNENEILSEFMQPKIVSNNDNYFLKIHPSVFDACIQPLFKLLPEDLIKPYIAAGAKKLHFFGHQSGELFLWGKLKKIESAGDKIWGDCFLINRDGKVIALLEDICLKQLESKLHIEDIMAKKASFTVNLATLSLPERRQYIFDFLKSQVAIIFSIPEEDILSDHSLRDLGIDSLMALVLMRAIEVGLEKNCPMQALMDGPTLNELANCLAGEDQQEVFTPRAENDTKWLRVYRRQPNAKLKLFCFPYGGGGASSYAKWQEAFPNELEVCPIQLPGREERMDEAPINDIGILIETLLENMREELDRPFAFFGHSFGSLIAFELTRNLVLQKFPQPKHLFVSAFPEPRIPTKSLDRLLKQLYAIDIDLLNLNGTNAIQQLSTEKLIQVADIFQENGLVGYGEHLRDKEIIKILLPIFIGDMSIVKSYQYYEVDALDIPITVFAGKKDTWVLYEDHLAWSEHTTRQFKMIEFDSGHMFIREESYKESIQKEIMHSLIKEEITST